MMHKILLRQTTTRMMVIVIALLVWPLSAGDLPFQAPLSPKVYATVEHNTVIIAWDYAAVFAVDSVTGYGDFEGFRVYRSTNGGKTWGDATDRIYDYDGNFVGWRPYAQFDLDTDEDMEFCTYVPYSCSGNDPVRGIEISGADPVTPWFDLGDNTGIETSFVDGNVLDGIAYTYTVTAYDMGLRTYELEYSDPDGDGIFTVDTVWSESNPGHFLGPDGGPYPSLESPLGTSEDDSNFVTIIPGYYASNITFPDNADADAFFVPQAGTFGTGDRSYEIVDPDELTESFMRFEIQADLESNAFENMACKDPYVYAWEISDATSQEPLTFGDSYLIADLDSTEYDYYLSLPGAVETAATIDLPDYKLIAPTDFVSDLFNGIRIQFNNISESAPAYVEFDDLEWSSADTNLQYMMSVTMACQNINNYKRRMNFDYRIDFFSEPTGDTVNVTIGGYAVPHPFSITNLTTGKQVRFKTDDFGVSNIFDLSGQYYAIGGRDTTWTRNEKLQLQSDTLLVNGIPAAVYTYNMWINLAVENMTYYYLLQTGQVASQTWGEPNTYEQGDMVFHRAMLWVANKTNIGIEPTTRMIDYNNDGVNDNPWRIYYPWQDGDYLIIRPEKFYTDGDAWIADMSQLGKSHTVTKKELEQVEVVPNPYLVRSGYNETASERKLRFTHLPLRCRISIYTITGELVDTIIHDEVYNGNAWWDLRNMNGNLVAPGLYIFVVEAGDQKQIGKFAVVR